MPIPTNRFLAALASLLFLSFAIQAQTEQFAPNALNRSKERVRLLLPGSDQPQEVLVEKVGDAYVLEGDILVNPIPDPRDGVIFAAAIERDRRWPGGRIPYMIQAGHPAASRVLFAINEINRLTNLQLVPLTNEANFVNIVYDPESGCAANVGRIKGGVNVITLSNNCSTGSIMHEFLHTAGLFHEQSRSDRDQFVEILEANIEQDRRDQFEKYECDYEGVDIGPYDYGSIMHYHLFAFNRFEPDDPDRPSIRILQDLPANVTVGQRDGLSDLDIAAINAMYPNTSLAEGQYDWVPLSDDGPILKSGRYFGLQNVSITELVRYKRRDYGINLSWTEDVNMRNIRFIRYEAAGTDLLSGDLVAIFVKDRGFIKYEKRKYGINLVWTDLPTYQWRLHSSTHRGIRVGQPFSIFNTVHDQYMVYCKRKWGINLRWVKDCGSVDAIPIPTRYRPRPRNVNENPVVSPPPPSTAGNPAPRTGSVVDHRRNTGSVTPPRPAPSNRPAPRKRVVDHRQNSTTASPPKPRTVPPRPNQPPATGRYYYLQSKISGLYLDVQGGGKASKTPVWQHTRNGSAAQHWKLITAGGGYYYLQSKVSGMYLDVSGGSKDAGAIIWQYPLNRSDAQRWKLIPAGSGYFYLQSKISGLYLDVKGGSKANGTPIWQYHPNRSDAQKWRFQPL